MLRRLQRNCIKFYVKKSNYICKHIWKGTVAFGESAISRTQAQSRYNRFKEGQEYVNNDPRSSISTTAENIEAVKKMILNNRSISITMLMILARPQWAERKFKCGTTGLRKEEIRCQWSCQQPMETLKQRRKWLWIIVVSLSDSLFWRHWHIVRLMPSNFYGYFANNVECTSVKKCLRHSMAVQICSKRS